MASPIITCDDVDFDYENVKIAYMNRIHLLKYNKQAQTWNRDKEIKLIKKLLQAKGPKVPVYHPALGNPPETMNIKNTNVDLAMENGAHILTFYNSHIQILPYEDCFNIFVDLHLRKSHAGLDIMYDILQKYFYFSKTILECFVQSCQVCVAESHNFIDPVPSTSTVQEKEKTEETEHTKHNLVVHIIFLDMSFMRSSINNEFKYMLVYRQEESGYILLRPLKDLDAQEVALELYNIFVDFGPPETIQTTHFRFFQDVIHLLQLTPIKYDCEIQTKTFAEDTLRYKISEYMNEWMRKSNSSNWVAACYIVQYAMNTDGNNSMEKLFGRRVGQTTKLRLSLEQTYAAEHLPPPFEGNCTSEDVSPVPLDKKVDLLIPMEEVKSEAGSDEDVIMSVSASTQTDGSLSKLKAICSNKPEKRICQVCHRIIMFQAQTCNKCNDLIHLFCGLRVAVDLQSFDEFQVVCNNCGKQ